jgi:hypothetical protein
MPNCFFARMRSWARVDGERVRAVDTRFFHKFPEGEEAQVDSPADVVVERTTRELRFSVSSAAAMDLDAFREPDRFVPRLPLVEKKTFRISV